jgi:hypothetical protein
MKSLKLVTLLCVFSIFALNAYSQDTYNPATVYIKGNTVDITINGVLITVEYLDNQPSSTYTPSTPYNTTNAWLWAVPAGYSGAWTAYHYKYDSQLPTIVTFLGYMYRLKQEIYPDASNPSVANWAWECINCGESSASTCPPTYSTGYFPLNTAQLNNGNDNTTPVNASGGGSIVGGMVRLTQERMCQTPLPLYNNDIYLRDACDPYAGLGYYGHADNRNVATPQKRYFADHDIDGPVLYGWNGGALGVRQRENWTATTGVTTEKVALQWTPNKVYIGTTLTPMPLELYSTVSCRNIKGTNTGFFVTGESTSRMFRASNSETNATVFSVSGNGDMYLGGNISYNQTLRFHNGTQPTLNISSFQNNTILSNPNSNGDIDFESDVNINGILTINQGLNMPHISFIQDFTSNSTIIRSNTFNNIVLNPQGSVTIGTLKNNPSKYILGVGGKMFAEEIWVKPENEWPDYVFKSTYKLLPLLEVESFIIENKHLPNVPSAIEVKENGISLGEMNAILLQKIEELTLYIIEQDKRISELEKKGQ